MEVIYMSIEKQKLYNEIETLPEELTNQVINFIEYLKFSYVDTGNHVLYRVTPFSAFFYVV